VRLNRWMHVAAGLAIVAGGVAVAAPAAQAGTPSRPDIVACVNQILTANNKLTEGSYILSLVGADFADAATEDADIAMTALASTDCARLDSYIGADLAAARSEITAGLQSLAQGQWSTAADQLDQAARISYYRAFSTLFDLSHPRS
jgi:hypothetical protein